MLDYLGEMIVIQIPILLLDIVSENGYLVLNDNVNAKTRVIN